MSTRHDAVGYARIQYAVQPGQPAGIASGSARSAIP